MYQRCIRLASALNKRGIGEGDTVAVMLPNIPEMFEVHFAVPMSGGVLNAINTRLDESTVAFILEHAEAKILITDSEYSEVVKAALAQVDQDILVIDAEDPLWDEGEKLGEMGYEALLAEGDEDYDWQMPGDEWDAISLNYTSGTTGDPKGVVFHHRGAYLNAVNLAVTWDMGHNPRYLWTLPMFHCNGWCFPWTLAAVAGTTICLRHVREEAIYASIRNNQVTHFCGAPIVLNTLMNAPDEMKQGMEQSVQVMTAGAAPPAAVIEGMERLGFEIIHAYGLTETYGPMAISHWQSEWDDLPLEDRCRLKARQGVHSIMAEDMMVGDPETLEPVPWDGETQGEIFMRGNLTMKGYLKNPGTTDASFAGGWFHSGDLAVRHPDGYVQIKDRSKDIIISGGENISSIEIEDTLYRHPAILEAAVVAKSDEKWGETPCAFVTLKPGEDASAEDIIQFCRDELAHFKVPKTIIFAPLLKTSTGKVQKFKMRQMAEDYNP
jgi:fatty-acyl-CoA synthase